MSEQSERLSENVPTTPPSPAVHANEASSPITLHLDRGRVTKQPSDLGVNKRAQEIMSDGLTPRSLSPSSPRRLMDGPQQNVSDHSSEHEQAPPPPSVAKRATAAQHRRTFSGTSNSASEESGAVSVSTPRQPEIPSATDYFSSGSTTAVGASGNTPTVGRTEMDSLESKTPVSALITKNEEFRKLFHLPKEETVIENFSCAVERKILLHGRMFISQHHVCFFSNVFGHKTLLSIPFSKITKIDKKMSALFVPNAISIRTAEQAYFFASFVWRDHTFRMLCDLWEINKKTAQMSALEAEQQISMLASKLRGQAPGYRNLPSGSRETDSDDQHFRGSGVYDVEENDEEGLRIAESSESSTGDSSDTTTSSSSSECSEDERGQQNGVLQPPLSVQPTMAAVGGSGSGAKAPRKKPAPVEVINNSQESASIYGATQLDDEVSMSPDTPMRTQPSDDDIRDDFFPSASVDDFNFFDKEAPITMQRVIDTEVRVSCHNLFNLFFSDKSTFSADFHAQRGDSDIVVGPWTKLSDQEVGRMRDVCFTSPIRQPFGPKSAKVFETHKYVFLNRSKTRLVIQMCSITPHVPYGDTFRLEYKFDVREVPAGDPAQPELVKCLVVVFIGVRMLKSTLFKGKIESEGMKEATQSHILLMDMLKAKVNSLDPLVIARRHKHKKARSRSASFIAAQQMGAASEQKKPMRRNKTAAQKDQQKKPLTPQAGSASGSSQVPAPLVPKPLPPISSQPLPLPSQNQDGLLTNIVTQVLSLSLRQIIAGVLGTILILLLVFRQDGGGPAAAPQPSQTAEIEMLRGQLAVLSHVVMDKLCRNNATDCPILNELLTKPRAPTPPPPTAASSPRVTEELILRALERSNTLHTFSIFATVVCVVIVCLSLVKSWNKPGDHQKRG